MLFRSANNELSFAECERLIVDGVTVRNQSLASSLSDAALTELTRSRREMFGDEPPVAVEARVRYDWVRGTLK